MECGHYIKRKLIYNVQKLKKRQLSFVHVAHLFDLIGFPTKYYQNIPKHMGFMACTINIPKNSLRGDNYKNRKTKIVILARNMPGHPDLQFCQTLSENFKGHGSCGAQYFALRR